MTGSKKSSSSSSSPVVLLEITDKNTYHSEQVILSQGTWSVFYKNQPINLKSFNILTNYPGPTYKKTSFANPGHAINLAKKLNTRHKTTDFTVVRLVKVEQIYPSVEEDADDQIRRY